MANAVIVDAVRTPLGKRGGALKDVRPDDLAAHVLRAITERTGIKPALGEAVVLGCVTPPHESGPNIARIAALLAGFPESVGGTSVNRQCGSGQQAVNFGAMEVLTGTSDVVIAGGVESMTRVPMGSDMGALNEKLLAKYEVVPQGISADLIADKYKISREQMDEFSFWSHRKAVKAIDEGKFRNEIVPVPVLDEAGNKRKFDTDEHPRRNTSLEKLATLPPAFRPDGRITAGNSSGINDGAAALLITTDEKAEDLGLKPRARIVAMAQVGVDPVLMLEGPIPASKKILKKAGLDLDDIDLWEINEAFASIPLMTIKTLGIDPGRVDVNGGASAPRPPLGATGAPLMTTPLDRHGEREGPHRASTLLPGVRQGVATVIERVS